MLHATVHYFCHRALADVSTDRRRENADMSQIPHKTPTDRIDPDHYEPSPSTGWRETTIICGGELPVFTVGDTDRPGDLL